MLCYYIYITKQYTAAHNELQRHAHPIQRISISSNADILPTILNSKCKQSHSAKVIILLVKFIILLLNLTENK